MHDKPFTLDRITRLVLWAGLAWGIVAVVSYLSDVLIPFVVALILAYLLHPLTSWLERFVRKRELAVPLSLFIIFSLSILLAATLLPMIMAEIQHMGRLISEVASNSELAAKAARQLPKELWAIIRDVLSQSDLKEFFTSSQGLDIVRAVANKALPGLWGAVQGARDLILGIVGLLIIALYTLFLLLDFQKLQANWKRVLPPAWRAPAEMFLSDFEAGMNRYFRAQALVSLITGVLCAIGFSLIGLPLAVVLGLLCGLLNMIPYLQILAAVPALFLGIIHWLETDISLMLVLLLILAVFTVVQIIQDAVLVPRIMGQAMGLSPWMMLLSLSIWGKLLGLLGLLIALPLTVLCLSYYRRLIEREGAASADTEEDVLAPHP